MTSLVWGAGGTRYFEAGTDRGVLYPPNGPGVAWSGLTGVKEAPSGGTPQSYYLDGIKYLQVAVAEEFNATITALSAPLEFAQCDGTGQVYAGLFVTQQPRKPFNFSYRTLVGNDVDPLGQGYKIHMVYNALAKPAQRSNQTLSQQPNPIELSWDITTVPIAVQGFKPSAHMVVDSRLAGADVITALEAYLYGTASVAPAFPGVDDILTIFDTYGNLRIDDLGNGRYEADGEPVVIVNPDLNFTINDPSAVDNGDGTFTINY